MARTTHRENHRIDRIGWLRAAVLGANDGIVSTASLVVGVAAAGTSQHSILVTGVAGLVAGAMSMAAGEYVSVHSQADTEKADLSREQAELLKDPAAEQRELAAIYAARGLQPDLAQQVAQQLMARDALGAHARDELGISELMSARPLQAAFASAASFAIGAALPLAVTALVPAPHLIASVAGASLVCLAGLGLISARAGGANVLAGAWRVTLWGALAMAVTAAAGALFGAVAWRIPKYLVWTQVEVLEPAKPLKKVVRILFPAVFVGLVLGLPVATRWRWAFSANAPALLVGPQIVSLGCESFGTIGADQLRDLWLTQPSATVHAPPSRKSPIMKTARPPAPGEAHTTLPTPLESFVHGVAIPLPEVLEKNTDSVWALWSESVSAEEPNLFINTVKLQT